MSPLGCLRYVFPPTKACRLSVALGYAGYEELYRDHGIKEVACMAHIPDYKITRVNDLLPWKGI